MDIAIFGMTVKIYWKRLALKYGGVVSARLAYLSRQENTHTSWILWHSTDRTRVRLSDEDVGPPSRLPDYTVVPAGFASSPDTFQRKAVALCICVLCTLLGEHI